MSITTKVWQWGNIESKIIKVVCEYKRISRK